VSTTLPGVAELDQRFTTFAYSVFRLETLQSYGNSGEDANLAAFLRGDPYTEDDEERAWAAMLRANNRAGRTQQRVHVVRQPVSEYVAYELTWEYGPHAAAGEEVRIIPVAGNQWPPDVPRRDFWFFDSREVFELDYDREGAWRGAILHTDAETVAVCARIRDAALNQSIPWRDYIASRPELAAHVPGQVEIRGAA
jgi:hypothetical protein